MALDRNNIVDLLKTVAKADPSAPIAYSWGDEKLSYNALNTLARNEINELAGTFSLYRANKHVIFSILEEVLTDVLPKKVEEAYGMFAETKTLKQGEKAIFRRKANNRARGKQFVTRAGLAGVYEVWKLGGTESFEVQTSAIGTAVQIGIEEFLDGRADMAELLEIVMEGIDDLIYKEIGASLIAAIHQLPANNVHTSTGFDETAFDRLIAGAQSYGDPVIYCTFQFAANMIPTEAWRYSDKMKDELWNHGRFTSYKGHKVIILPQGFTDETNSTLVVDPGYCWIIPSGGDNTPVKVVFEGETLVDERKNDDWSREIQIYKKVGVSALMTNNIFVYEDENLLGKMNFKDYNTAAASLAVKNTVYTVTE